MIIQRLINEQPAHVRVKKGTILKCKRGTIWMTACGEDIILRAGEELRWNRRCNKLIVMPLRGDAVVALRPEPSLLEEFSLFHHQTRLTAALAG